MKLPINCNIRFQCRRPADLPILLPPLVRRGMRFLETIMLVEPLLLCLLLATASSFGTQAGHSNRPKAAFSSTRTSFVSQNDDTLVRSDRRPVAWLPRGGGSMGGGVGSTSSGLGASTSAETVAISVSEENLALLSDRGRAAVMNLVEHDVDGAQQHVYGDWPPLGIEDEGKQRLAEQVRKLERCPAVVGIPTPNLP